MKLIINAKYKDGDIIHKKDGKTWMYREGVPDEKLDYDVNEGLENRERFYAYKMFRTKYNPENKRTWKEKGRLYPLYINASNYYEIGPWYKCGYGASRVLIDEFTKEPIYDKNGEMTVITNEKGLAFRPGGHAGGLPLMRQRGRKDLDHEGDNNFDYFHSQEVFAVIEFSGHYDYTELSKEKQANSSNPNDPYEAGFTDINDINREGKGMGYYNFKTNTNAPDDEAWFIASAFRIVRVIDDNEMVDTITKYNNEHGTNFKPQKRGAPNGKTGDKFNADFTQFGINNSRRNEMKEIESSVIKSSRWSDGHIHCDKCGAIMKNAGYGTWYCPNCDDDGINSSLDQTQQAVKSSHTVRARYYQNEIPVIECKVDDKIIYSGDFDSIEEARKAAYSLRDYINDNIDENAPEKDSVYKCCTEWDKQYNSADGINSSLVNGWKGSLIASANTYHPDWDDSQKQAWDTTVELHSTLPKQVMNGEISREDALQTIMRRMRCRERYATALLDEWLGQLDTSKGHADFTDDMIVDSSRNAVNSGIFKKLRDKKLRNDFEKADKEYQDKYGKEYDKAYADACNMNPSEETKNYANSINQSKEDFKKRCDDCAEDWEEYQESMEYPVEDDVKDVIHSSFDEEDDEPTEQDYIAEVQTRAEEHGVTLNEYDAMEVKDLYEERGGTFSTDFGLADIDDIDLFNEVADEYVNDSDYNDWEESEE